MGDWDVMFFCETWLDKRGWEKIRGYMPRGFRWKMQLAKRRSKRGRAMGDGGRD